MKKAKKWLFWIFILIVLSAAGISYYIDYAIRKHYFRENMEGLVLASSYKNLVTDNLVNRRANLSEGVPAILPNKNTGNITLNDQTGVITIKVTDKEGSFVLYMSPGAYIHHDAGTTFRPYQTGDDFSQTRLAWRCTTLNKEDFARVPSECRQLDAS